MKIEQLKPSQRVAGRWLAVMEDGSILRLGENEVLNFSLYAAHVPPGIRAQAGRLGRGGGGAGCRLRPPGGAGHPQRRPVRRDDSPPLLRQRKLRDELYRRGVPRDLWEDALSQAEDPAEAIDAFVAKKLKGAAVSDPKELKKVSDALVRRGYSWTDISQALRRYGAQWED